MSLFHKSPHGNGVIVSDEIHARIHIGQYFSASFIDTSVTNGEINNIVLVVGGVTHIRFRADANVNTLLQAYSAPAYSGGTPVTPVNHNQLSSLVSANSLLTAPTVSDPGTLIEDWLALGGSGGGRAAGLTDTVEEFIIAPGDYLFRTTNLTSSAGLLHVHFSWYEPGL